MNLEIAKPRDKKYLKLRNLAKRQNDVLNKLIMKHNSILTEKDRIIETQYSIIQDQSKNIEILLNKLDETYNKKNILKKFKSFLNFQEPILST